MMGYAKEAQEEPHRSQPSRPGGGRGGNRRTPTQYQEKAGHQETPRIKGQKGRILTGNFLCLFGLPENKAAH